MYTINHFPNSKHTFSIVLSDNNKFFQLIDNTGGVIAESNSWRELKRWAEYKRLTVKIYQ
jgi:hypothetical protein